MYAYTYTYVHGIQYQIATNASKMTELCRSKIFEFKLFKVLYLIDKKLTQ